MWRDSWESEITEFQTLWEKDDAGILELRMLFSFKFLVKYFCADSITVGSMIKKCLDQSFLQES